MNESPEEIARIQTHLETYAAKLSEHLEELQNASSIDDMHEVLENIQTTLQEMESENNQISELINEMLP